MYWTVYCTDILEGDNKKEREQELKMMMKRLEAKYAALQIVPVISKLGTPKVNIFCFANRRNRAQVNVM